MSDPSLSNPETNPDQAVASSEQAQPMAPTNVSGSAMLDARIATGDAQPEGDPVEHPIATNFSGASPLGESKTGDVSTMAGSRSAGEGSISRGQVNLHNHSDVADDQMQGILPDTDPAGVPMNENANLPD